MGTIAVSRILDRASRKLLDVTKVRWTAAELLADYNAVKGIIVGLKPDAFVRVEAVQLVAGSKQTIPATAIAFRRLTRWMGAGGSTPGAMITQVDRDDLDHSRPEWHIETGTRVKHWVHDLHVPRVFWIYPNATGYVEGAWTATPPDAASAAEVIPLDDIYEDCIYRGVMAAALSKNSKSLDNSRVAYYEGKFNEFLGLKNNAQYRFSPKAAAQEQTAEMPGGER